jgi:hypothetical protein
VASESEVIEMTVVGIADEPIPGRRASRARVVATGLTDDDIDGLIKQAQKARTTFWMMDNR